jgi:predicted nucleic acid-binding protein
VSLFYLDASALVKLVRDEPESAALRTYLGGADLTAAGAIAEPALRALDAIHVAAGAHVGPFEAFVTYYERQAAAAQLTGLRTTAPGS